MSPDSRRTKYKQSMNSILCTYDPLGDFTGKRFSPNEIDPMAFEQGTTFRVIKTGKEFAIQDVVRNSCGRFTVPEKQ